MMEWLIEHPVCAVIVVVVGVLVWACYWITFLWETICLPFKLARWICSLFRR